tara:strand:+ start:873 stop:1301 length:429 start_codon:yes stop_codon:yes gene_type:complete
MKISLCFKHCKPLSLNKGYTINAKNNQVRRFPSKEYKQLESVVCMYLAQQKNEIKKFNNYFDESKHYIIEELRFYFPVMKKDNTINKTSGDVFNLPKIVEDILFKKLNADDSQVMSGYVHKIHSKEIRIEIDLTIKELKHVI